MRATPGRTCVRPLSAALAAASLVALAGCTSHGDDKRTPLVDAPTRTAVGLPAATDSVPGGTTTATSDAPAGSLAVAMASVPASVLYASFTDLSALRTRLGFGDVTSESPAGERFDFWEAARADGAMLTGTRLYDDTSQMEADYGWTADDVSWEIDFSGDETGCTRDMLCDPSGGAVMALRDGVDSRVVLSSLVENGFREDGTNGSWVTDRPGQPFERALYLPTINAVAVGNEIGLIRVRDVFAGAPSLAEHDPALAEALGSPESAYLDTTGCVSPGEALGPDVTDEEYADYLAAHNLSRLAEAKAWAVAIGSGRAATAVLELESAPPDPVSEVARRTGVMASWPGQSGLAFADVARAAVSVRDTIERVDFDVAAMPAFAAMVVTHDAPWALCPASPPT